MNEVKKALQAGDKERAFALLRDHLAANPKDPNAWLWMSEATSNPKQKIDALKRVLMFAPQHPHAAAIRQRLESLTNKQSTAREESKSRQASTQPPVHSPPVHSPPVTQPISPSLPTVPPAASIEKPIRKPAKATFPEEEALSFAQEPPPPPRQQRLGIRQEPKSRDESVGATPPAQSTVQELRQSLMSEATMIIEEEESEESSLTSPPKPPSEQGLPRWTWLLLLLIIVALSGFLWVAYNMAQAN